MCGRYVAPDSAAMERAWRIDRRSGVPFARRFNVAPTLAVPVLRAYGAAGLALDAARWGLVPPWWREDKPPRLSFNARSEEAAGKPMWRQVLRESRCLVPAEGWYEWRPAQHADPQGGGLRAYKQPYYIHRTDGRPFAFAGLWSLWRPPAQAEPLLTCAILTRAAAAPLTQVHERMPVVLEGAAAQRWLDPQLRAAAPLQDLIREASDSDFEFFTVATLVNNARNDSPELVQRVAA